MSQRFPAYCWLVVAFLVGVVGLGGPVSYAQTPALEEPSGRPVEVVVAPVYQQVDDDETTLRVWSTRARITVPIRERTLVQSSIQYGYATSETLPTVQGPTNLQLRAQHTAPVGQGRLVAAVDVDVPTGARQLTSNELRTTIQTSQRPYGFRVPTFGQGWSVAPTVTWAFPVSTDLALGVGLSGAYRAGYRPLANSATDYVPGNEIEVRIGGDYRASPASTFALDGKATYITPDTEGGESRFEARYTLSARAQYMHQRNDHVLRVQARYEGWPESRYRPVLLTDDGSDTSSLVTQRVLPSVWEAAVGYTRSLQSRAALGLRADIAHYTATNRFSAQTIGRAQVIPRLRWSSFTISVHGAVTLGSFTGFETGFRTAVRL